MKKNISVLLILAFILSMLPTVSLSVLSQGSEEGLTDSSPYPGSGFFEISAPSAILTDARRGQVLFDKNADQKLHISIASKIMTALVVCEQVRMDSIVTISKDSALSEGSIIFLEPGEKYPVEDLLYAIMLRSYNDAANALAEFAGGSIENFVSLMNNKAAEIGLKDTSFVNPTGLYAEGQYTTARDLALLVRNAIQNSAFNRIFASRTKLWSTGEDPELMFNQNTLFWEYEGVDGGKTGYNDSSKHSAVTTASKSSQRLISVVLDTPETSVFEDSKNLLRYGYENYRINKLVSANEVVTTLMINNIELRLVSLEDVYYTHPAGDDFIANINTNLKQNIELPVSKSQILGTAEFVLKDGTEIKVNLFSSREIPAPESIYSFVRKKLLEHRDILYLLLFLVVLEFILIIVNLFKLFRWIIRTVFFRKKIKNHS